MLKVGCLWYLLDVISNCCERKLWPIAAFGLITVFGRDRACSAIGTAKAVHTDDEESRGIKDSSRTAQQRSPPIAHIGTASERMADDHCIVCIWREHAARCVRDGNIV